MEAAVRWSPHSNGQSRRFLVVDVADQSLTLNQVDNATRTTLGYHSVARYGRLPHFGAFAWSAVNESLVALGLVSGNANLIQLREGKEGSETVATFKIKQQRKCNSVAFSSQNWLAVALDKTRSDVCLNIYDTNADSTAAQEPVRRLCPAELVSSVRFFATQPQEIIVATGRAFMRLYDLRDGYLSTGPSAQVATRNGNNIAIDPLDENYFASAGSTDDPTVTVWDKRWLSQSPLLTTNNGAVFNFSPAVTNTTKTTVWSLRYSGQQRGRLAICSSTGELRLVDMIEGPTQIERSVENTPHNPFGGSPWISNRYVSQTRSLEYPYHDEHHGKDPTSRIVAFDWMTDDGSGCEQGLIAMRPLRDVDVLRVPAVASQAQITARQDLCIGLGDVSITEPKSYIHAPSPGAPYEHVNGTEVAEDFGPRDYDGERGSSENEEFGQVISQRDSPALAKLLASGTLPRERCSSGYLFDCQQNAAIVNGNWQLERLWEIVDRFNGQAANDGMVHDSLDLSYIGISGLWSENIGNNANRKLSLSTTKVSEAIFGLNNKNEFPPFDGERTEFPEHRQLCLLVCGWKFTTETLEEECQQLIERGLYYQAIVQAVLHEHKHIALNLLRTLIRSKTIPNIGLNALLASNDINAEQREMCMWMAADTQDPALKALLTFLTTGDWRDVMKTNYLHLGYRVALGLKYLNDTELSGFIQTETARAIKNGDLEGILLTGLGEQAMDLFQTYITKTSDLQTAVLATAFTNPLYVDDVRWDMWKDGYFAQLQSWRLFSERTKFTVQHSQIARTRSGHSLLPRPESQVSVLCTHCQRPLERKGVSSTTNGSAAVRVQGPAANAGTICPRCGRHMPRCGICMLWLGTPDPARSGGARQLQKLSDMMAKFLCFCASCGHGFHADHARTWFKKHGVCPVSNCQCLCKLDR